MSANIRISISPLKSPTPEKKQEKELKLDLDSIFGVSSPKSIYKYYPFLSSSAAALLTNKGTHSTKLKISNPTELFRHVHSCIVVHQHNRTETLDSLDLPYLESKHLSS